MLLADDGDDGATIGPPVHKSHCPQLGQRLADRGARNLETFGQRSFVKLAA